MFSLSRFGGLTKTWIPRSRRLYVYRRNYQSMLSHAVNANYQVPYFTRSLSWFVIMMSSILLSSCSPWAPGTLSERPGELERIESGCALEGSGTRKVSPKPAEGCQSRGNHVRSSSLLSAYSSLPLVLFDAISVDLGHRSGGYERRVPTDRKYFLRRLAQVMPRALGVST